MKPAIINTVRQHKIKFKTILNNNKFYLHPKLNAYFFLKKTYYQIPMIVEKSKLNQLICTSLEETWNQSLFDDKPTKMKNNSTIKKDLKSFN